MALFSSIYRYLTNTYDDGLDLPNDHKDEKATQRELGEAALRVPAHLGRLQHTAVHRLQTFKTVD
jgi:hypothetical protein